MKAIHLLIKIKWYALIVLLGAGGLYYYFSIYSAGDSTADISFYAVETVGRGDVTSGILTTGDIVAAKKLDIDVYKQLSRIDVVNVQNGTHVEAGDVLFSFDKSDAYVDTKSSQVTVAEAALALEEEQANAVNPNTQIRTKENQIAGYEKSITDAKKDIEDAYRDFLNQDLEAVPHKERFSVLYDRVEPTLSGRYVSDAEGQYVIDVYSSNAESGYSYRVSGLESMTDSVIFGKAVNLGTRGLKITFPNDTKTNDKWVVYVPNTEIATYQETETDYETEVANLNKTIADAKVGLANSQQELSDLKRTDTNTYRNLNVEKAETALAEARQRLSKNYDVVQELDIVAPFSGSVEGMENVVVGATPTGGSEDSINLGTLISDEFLTTFKLGAADVAKVEVGQKVKVTVTSFTNQPVFDAFITQISSLPASSGVAQYEIQALLNYDRTTADTILREGMLADIEVVQEEKTDTLRVPVSAITYEQGVPKVTIVDSLTDEQKIQAARMGIVRASGAPLATYDVEVTVGITGQYFVEILDGLKAGDIIVSTSITQSSGSESVVQQAGFGPGSGQRQADSAGAPPRE